jgi:hypothetical protein
MGWGSNDEKITGCMNFIDVFSLKKFHLQNSNPIPFRDVESHDPSHDCKCKIDNANPFPIDQP